MINFTFPTRHKFYLGSTLSFKFSFLSRAPPFGACSWLIHLSPRRDTFRERGRWRGRKREIGREKERWRERERGVTHQEFEVIYWICHFGRLSYLPPIALLIYSTATADAFQESRIRHYLAFSLHLWENLFFNFFILPAKYCSTLCRICKYCCCVHHLSNQRSLTIRGSITIRLVLAPWIIRKMSIQFKSDLLTVFIIKLHAL